MKTKYIKVPVSERPKKDGYYFTIVDNPNAELKDDAEGFNKGRTRFINDSFKSFYEVKFWLEEVPDREEEMKEDLIRNLKKAVEALELIGSITGEEMPLTIEDAKRMINKYS